MISLPRPLSGASSGTNPVTGTTYNGFSEATGVTSGSADTDTFTYDGNTGRMTQYKATINGSPAYDSSLTWNANGTLQNLATTDPFNFGNSATANVQAITNGYNDTLGGTLCHH